MLGRARFLLILLVAPLLFGALGELSAEPLSAKDKAAYERAFQQLDKGQYAKAIQEGRKAKDAVLLPVLEWTRLRLDPKQGDFERIVKFMRSHPDWPGQRALVAAAEQVMPSDLSDQEVLDWFDEHPALSGEGALRHVKVLLKRGRIAEAEQRMRLAWQSVPFDIAAEREVLANHAKMLTKQDHLARIDRLVAQRSQGAALRLARRLGKEVTALTKARLDLAFRRPGVDGSIARVPASLRNHPGLVYERALWRQRKGRYEGVVELIDPPPQLIPEKDLDRWWRLRRWVARKALEGGDISVAYRMASSHGAQSGISFAEGEFLAGWIALRFLQEPLTALQHFSRLYHGVTSPISRSRGAYWAGEAARAQKDEALARQWYLRAAGYNHTFYGQLGAERLPTGGSALDAPPRKLTAEAKQTFRAQERVKILAALLQIEAEKTAQLFFASLRSHAAREEDFRLIADFATQMGEINQALTTAKLAQRDGHELSTYLHPLPFATRSSRKAALVLGLVRQESAFDEEAKSRAGALGLMQLMPATAKSVARKIKMKYSKGRLTSDPEYNLRLGSAYLDELLERYDNYLPLVLAAYNAGPSRANRWIQDYGDPRAASVDPVDWIEMIPFSETRNYVQRVMESTAVYGRVLSLSGMELGDLLDGTRRPLLAGEKIN